MCVLNGLGISGERFIYTAPAFLVCLLVRPPYREQHTQRTQHRQRNTQHTTHSSSRFKAHTGHIQPYGTHRTHNTDNNGTHNSRYRPIIYTTDNNSNRHTASLEIPLKKKKKRKVFILIEWVSCRNIISLCMHGFSPGINCWW